MLVALNEISKSFGDKLILDNLSATIENNDRVGLLGANGIGKSTLLNILTGRLACDTGSVAIQGGVTIGMLEQNSGLVKGNSIYMEMESVFSDLLSIQNRLRELEQLMAKEPHESDGYAALAEEYSRVSIRFETRDGYHTDVKIKTVLNGMGFADRDWQTPIDVLSGGEKTRLALAKLLLENPDLLVLDEPTNHLDFRTLMWLEDYLKGYRGGLLVVSHDRYFLDKMVSKMWEIESKRIVSYVGNYTKYRLLRTERITRMNKEYEAQQIKMTAMKEYAAKNISRASTSNMAKSRLHQLANMEVLEKPNERVPIPHFSFNFQRNPVKDLLTVRGLSLIVGEGEDRQVLSQNLSFDIKKGDKVALIGPNGVGKSTLLKVLQGILLLEQNQGEIYWGDKVEFGYYEQENLTLNPENTAMEELWGRFPRLPPYEVRSMLGRVLITGDNAFKKIGVLSGGERARVALSILMMEESNTLLLDEPTNHLDLQSKEALEEALVKFDGTLLFVSHDRYFLNTIPNRIFELSETGLTCYEGNFDAYLEESAKRVSLTPAVQEVKTEETEKPSYRSKQERAEQVKRKSEIRKLEAAIEKIDARITELEAEIADPNTGTDYARLSTLCEELETAKAEHDKIFAAWIETAE